VLGSDDGARHLIGSAWRLGEQEDGEPDGQPSAGATGDDDPWFPGDDDGVYVHESGVYKFLRSAPTFQANKQYTLGIVASTDGYLNAWFDFNADGDWSDPGEQVFGDTPLVAGTNALTLHIPLSVSNATSFARFRFGSQTNLSFTGFAIDGEVEDYLIHLQETLRILTTAQDNDGIALQWNGPGYSYTVQHTTSLLDAASWKPVPGVWPAQTNSWFSSDVLTNRTLFLRVRRQ
jgi:hypothetical protein